MRPFVFVLPLLWFSLPAEDWPRFRGPNGDGVSTSTNLPVQFGPAQNVAWKLAVPPGRSSPIVVRDRVFVTALEGGKLATLAIDARSGRLLWRRDVARERQHKIYEGNDTATPTPVSDGEWVFAFFPDAGLIAYDLAGQERWRFRTSEFDSFYGMSASPVVHGNSVFLVCDLRKGSYLAAVAKDTGKLRWRVNRPQAATEGYATPTVYTPAAGKPMLLVSGAHRVDAYDVETGEVRWFAGNQGVYPVGSPVVRGDLVYAVAMGGEKSPYPEWESLLQQADTDKDGRLSQAELDRVPDFKGHFGFGDKNQDGVITREEYQAISDEAVTDYGLTANRIGGETLWRFKKSFSYLITPLVYRDVIYLVKTGGIITSLDPSSGAVLKAGRSPDAIDEYFASPVAADGKVYFASHGGKVTVVKAGAQWEVLAVNDLGEPVQATPAIANGQLFIRTARDLYCFQARH